MTFTTHPDGSVTVNNWAPIVDMVSLFRTLPPSSTISNENGLLYLTMHAANGAAEYRMDRATRQAVLVRRWASVNG